MADLSRKTALIWDAGSDYVHIAEAIAPEYGKVLYFCPWESAFTTPKGLLPGQGLPGVERCRDFFDEVEAADIVIFCDVGQYGLQEWLRQSGMPVFGCGNGGKYETDRALLKKLCKDHGIAAAPWDSLEGTSALREVLETVEDLYVKISYMRGATETFHHKTWEQSKGKFYKLVADLHPYEELAQFLIEFPLDDEDPTVEIGFDTWCADGQFPDVMLYGYEEKDSGFVGRVGLLPDRLTGVRDALGVGLGSARYRGALSTETRESPSGSYLIDLTCRFPSPPSELQSKLVSNLGQVVWDVAHGTKPNPEYGARFGAQVVIKSNDFAEGCVALKIDQHDLVAVHGHCIIDGTDYAVGVSEIEEMAGAIGMGDTLEEAIEQAYEVAEGVSGLNVRYDSGALQRALDQVEKGESLGINFMSMGESTGADRMNAA